jgi:hypothetical protein
MAWNPGRKGEPLHPPGFQPKRRIVGSPNYTLNHPTRYRWARHVRPLIRRLYREMGGPEKIHINTYVWHPPFDPGIIDRRYDRLSFDTWGALGRGDPIGFERGQRVFNKIWNDEGEPYIDWIIWRRTIRIRHEGFRPRPFGTNWLSFHDDHPHVTFLRRGVLGALGVTPPEEAGTPLETILAGYEALQRAREESA